MSENKENQVVKLEAGERTLADFCRQIMQHKNAKGLPLGTHQNLKILLDTQGIGVRYNIMKKETEIIIPNYEFTTDNYYNASATYILSLMRQIEMTTAHYMELLELLADSIVYNPIAEWIATKEWDGKGRLPEIFATITPAYEDDRPFIETAISKWMLGAIESICNPAGADLPGILVLQGFQKIGKTWWVRKLVPDGAVNGAVKIGVQIDPSNKSGKDSIEQCVAHWIVEFGELDAIFRRADIAALKNFLTLPTDTFRRSYAKRKSEYPRRTAFVANVNESHYLIDETGNRRFWTIACKAVDSWHTIDMQQLWAEIYYKRMVEKLPYTFNDAEEALLTAINERHMVIEPIREMLAYKYNWESNKENWRHLSATQIAVELGYAKPDARDVRKVAAFVRKLNGGTEGKMSNGRELLAIPNRTIESYTTQQDYNEPA